MLKGGSRLSVYFDSESSLNREKSPSNSSIKMVVYGVVGPALTSALLN
jgi:hypothetical protein